MHLKLCNWWYFSCNIWTHINKIHTHGRRSPCLWGFFAHLRTFTSYCQQINSHRGNKYIIQSHTSLQYIYIYPVLSITLIVKSVSGILKRYFARMKNQKIYVIKYHNRWKDKDDSFWDMCSTKELRRPIWDFLQKTTIAKLF